jgi:hypothetical protein
VSDRPTLADVFRRSDDVVGRRVAGEYVLVPLMGRGIDADGIYTLNRVATAVWEALDGQRDGTDVVHLLVEGFEVQAEQAGRDYLDLVETLEGIGAVRRV